MRSAADDDPKKTTPFCIGVIHTELSAAHAVEAGKFRRINADRLSPGCLIGRGSDPGGTVSGWVISHLQDDRHVASRLNSLRNLNDDLHQAGDFGGRGIGDGSRNAADVTFTLSSEAG